ncbi:MAG: O-antigen ligase family protein [Pelatocladus maniniholoensis HA4357-MV3]|jgi:O-antigen ligase|uniref:O-antigen ligase family protein n=1 Tax=Pelatocladus maniniholoensis HA4357-MV3 TaxID=1117104 RepID=A0A9E3H823_9NOST|nr:O-antigen ligase family protein [Pelatocladus maniniholoensis HA4357-MV3]BAZ66839.1 O-antigen polymerase [Fischerella sp. NIES-4106]
MLTNQRTNSSVLPLLIGLVGVGVGIVAGFLAGAKPLYLCLALVAIAVVILFFTRFEQTVMGLLIFRTCLDPWSAQQIPAAFAVGLDILTLLYVTIQLLTGQTVHTDRFWWFFAAWVMVQGLWVMLLPLGGLGLNVSLLPESIREWIRLFSWLMVYLLVMQLKDRLPPEKIISTLFLALVVPITVALIQVFMPSILPFFLLAGGDDGSRIKGTIGHSNGFTTLLLLFIGLTYWKLRQSRQYYSWLLLLGLLAFLFVGTKALFGLIMIATFVLVLITPRLNIANLIGGVIFLALVIGLFASTEFGQERLNSVANTPLLNPDIDVSRAILMSQGDYNSFNWRLSHWHLLLNAWQQFPIFGYGLASANTIGNGFIAHNDYVRALVEEGIIGLVIFLLFLFVQGIRIVQLIQSAPPGSAKRDLCLTMLAIFLSIPVAMVTENIWSHTTLFFYWMTLMAVAGWNWNDTRTV